MAETVHLSLKLKAGGDIKGESTQKSNGRENTIECVSYEYSLESAREAGSGMAVGRRKHNPINIVKRIDNSTPLLVKALTENSELEGEFKFFRPNPDGDGTTEQFFTVKIVGARIASISHEVENCIDPASTNTPPLERVSFVFGDIIWTEKRSGAQHQDKWA